MLQLLSPIRALTKFATVIATLLITQPSTPSMKAFRRDPRHRKSFADLGRTLRTRAIHEAARRAMLMGHKACSQSQWWFWIIALQAVRISCETHNLQYSTPMLSMSIMLNRHRAWKWTWKITSSRTQQSQLTRVQKHRQPCLSNSIQLQLPDRGIVAKLRTMLEGQLRLIEELPVSKVSGSESSQGMAAWAVGVAQWASKIRMIFHSWTVT